MNTPFDGVGLWVFPAFWGGTDLTLAEAQAYAAQGVRWVAIKCSDGTTGDPDYSAQFDVAQQGGLLPIPWCYVEPGGNEAGQAETAWKAAGSPPSGAVMLCDIESAINVGVLGRALASYGLTWGTTTWGNPSPLHNGAPSIGQLADIGCAAFLPQAYYSAWQVSAQAAIQTAVSNYGGLGLGPYTRPLLPIVDGPAILTAAQACHAAGLNGISAFRHGANGITAASFAGVAALFGAAPTPTYLTLAAPTVISQLSSPTDPWDACGEADVASVVTDAGIPESAGAVVQWALANGAAQTGGTTTGANLIAELEHFGLSGTEYLQPISETVPAALARKHEVIVLISSDADGNPATPGVAGHWLLIWGQDSTGAYKAMNPLSNPAGQLIVYPADLLASCDKHDAVEIDYILPKDGGVPLIAPVTNLAAGQTYSLPKGDTITVT